MTEEQTPPTSDFPEQVHERQKQSRSYAIVASVIFVIAVLAVSIYYATSPDRSKKAQVAIDSSQFVPATLTVSPGTYVTWTNDDSQVHQVAADPFPKDNSISGFNSQVSLQNHDSYTYQFNQKGTYTYHDEKNPFSMDGTVVVK